MKGGKKNQQKTVPGWWSVKAGKQRRAAVFPQPGLDGQGVQNMGRAPQSQALVGAMTSGYLEQMTSIVLAIDFKSLLSFLISHIGAFGGIKRCGCKSVLSCSDIRLFYEVPGSSKYVCKGSWM